MSTCSQVVVVRFGVYVKVLMTMVTWWGDNCQWWSTEKLSVVINWETVSGDRLRNCQWWSTEKLSVVIDWEIVSGDRLRNCPWWSTEKLSVVIDWEIVSGDRLSEKLSMVIDWEIVSGDRLRNCQWWSTQWETVSGDRLRNSQWWSTVALLTQCWPTMSQLKASVWRFDLNVLVTACPPRLLLL